MSQPSDSYSVRSLAEILREHGLESEQGTRPGRRRRGPDEAATGRSAPVDTSGRPVAADPRPAPAGRGAQAPRPGTPGRPGAPAPAARPSPARAAAPAAAPPAGGRAPAPRAEPARPGEAARNGAPLRGTPSRPVWEPAEDRRPTSGLGDLAAPGPARRHTDAPAPVDQEPTSATPAAPAGTSSAGRSSAGRSPAADRAPAEQAPTAKVPGGPSTAAIPALQTSSSQATGERRAGAHRTGPQPAVRAEAEADAEPVTGRQGALAWVRFVGELVVALAVGIGLYFAFTLLWELMPYAALVAAPLAVTGLVAGVAAWRERQGQGPLALRLLAGLLLAGTVLVIAPAAGLLAGS
ncbi:hypothetical protein [Modestobacter sp. SYSU DS0290]